MIISEKQIMHLLSIARTSAELLNNSDDMMDKGEAIQIYKFIDVLHNQQSSKLFEVKYNE